MRYCAFLFGLLIVPMTFIKGIGGGLDMLIISVLMGFMLRNIDAVFANIFRGGNADTPSGIVPFILPLAMTVGFGTIFDFFIVASVLFSGGWNLWLFVMIFVLALRVVVCRTTFPLARMLLDPSYQPRTFFAQTGSGQQGLLLRRARVDPPTSPGELESQPEFRPFTGTVHTLNSSSGANPSPRQSDNTRPHVVV